MPFEVFQGFPGDFRDVFRDFLGIFQGLFWIVLGVDLSSLFIVREASNRV
jgi:hypothetical protein